MNKYLLITLYTVLFSLIPSAGNCSHIVGGELYYEYQGNDQYKVVLKIYRDCINANPNAVFDDPASVGIFNSSGVLVQQLLMYNPVITTLPVSINNPCLVVPPVICTEEGIYTSFITLPDIPGGYDLVYQRCCRNNIIQNIMNPSSTGSTYISHIPEQAVSQTNNAPHFSNLPPLVLCNGESFVFDHSAIDLDGDDLVYEFCNPFEGANTTNPMPQPPNNPPYTNILWVAGYSTNNQIIGTPGLQINATTGELTCTPSTNGIYVVGICVKEYRNGVLINTTLRDFQFTVVTCSANIISAVPNQTVLCDGYTVAYTNQSTNSSFYHWDFGVPNITNDTSNLITPTYTYADTGLYEVTLIANPGWPCADTSIAEYLVQYPITGTIDPIVDLCIIGNSSNFQINGNFTPDANVVWNFGNATPSSSTTFSNPNVSFNNPGIYNVTATVEDRGCTRDFTVPIEIFAQPDVIVPDLIICDNLSIFPTNSTTNATSYQWDFGDPSTTSDISSLQNPTYTYPSAGTYTATLIVDNNNMCFASTIALFTVRDGINVSIDPIATQCFSSNNFSLSTTGTLPLNSTFSWDFGPNSTPSTSNQANPNITFSQEGNHIITYTVVDGLCIDTYSELVQVIVNPEAILLPDTICDGPQVNFINGTTNSTTFHWDFGVINSTSDTSGVLNPTFTYPTSGTYTVSLIASPDGICPDTTQVDFLVKAPITATISTTSPQCVNENSFDFFPVGNYSSNAQFNWLFDFNSTPSSSTLQNPSGITYNASGSYIISLDILDESCEVTIFDSVSVFPEPQIGFEISADTGCAPLTINFLDTSSYIGNANFFWDFGDGNISTEQFPTHEYTLSGVYSVSYSLSTLEGCIQTFQLVSSNLINVLETPEANFSISTPDITGISTITDYSSGSYTDQFFIIENNTLHESEVTYAFEGIGFIEVLDVVVNDLGCSDTAETIVEVSPEELIYIPNSFTPNGDNVNDVFQVYVYGTQTFEIKIFDRWGQLFYAGNESSQGWDGKIKGKPVQNDVYVWRVKYTDYDNVSITKYGHVSVIR